MRRLLEISTYLLLSTCLAGCSMPEGMNDDCEWPPERTFTLDLRNRVHQRHLVEDVRVAEELGIRYADLHLARGPARQDWPQTRDDCDTKLFSAIVHSHAVSMADVRQARQRLAEAGWDPAVHLPVAALYSAAAFSMARWIRKRFPGDEKPAAIVATLFASVVIGVCFLMLGHLWGGAVEMIRVGNMHMSYRVGRLGWRQHAAEVFARGVLLFWLAVLVCYRVPPPAESAAGAP